MAEGPTFRERVVSAYKALTGSIPHPQGSYGVQSYSSWADWDRSLYGGNYNNTRVNYAQAAGDPSASSLIMAGVRWAGSTLPEAPLQVKETTGNKGESEPVANHPLVDLWRRPNPFYSGSLMMKAVAFSWITKGDVYIRKVWNDAGTKVVQLWYEPHYLVRPRWLGDNRGAWIYGDEADDQNAFVNYYEVDRGSRKFRVEVSDMIHFRDGLNPETRCGQNGIAAILREVYGDNEAANMFAALMANDGIPKVILVADPDVDITPEKLKELTDDVNRKTTGDNRKKALALSGVKPYKLPWSPDELDLRVARYMSEDRFAAVTGIPAVELELGAGRESSIYNNVRQASERATERFLVPAWNYFAEELTVQLLPDFETEEKSVVSVKSWRGLGLSQSSAVKAAGGGKMRYVSHDLSKVRALQEDTDAIHARVRGDYEAGIIDRAEGRSALGYEVRNEDKDFYSPKAGAAVTPTQDQSSQDKTIKSAPPELVVDEVVKYFDEVLAPEGAAGILNASVSSNGNGKG